MEDRSADELEMKERRRKIFEAKPEFELRWGMELERFLRFQMCPVCGVRGTLSKSCCVGYTDPPTYTANCSVCGQSLGFGFNSIPHWAIDEVTGKVIETSGRRVVWHRPPKLLNDVQDLLDELKKAMESLPMKHTRKLTFEDLRKLNLARVPSFNHALEEWSECEWSNAVAGEVGELCNMTKKRLRAPGTNESMGKTTPTLEDVANEAADIVIYLDLLAARMGFSLAEAVVRKFDEKSAEVGFEPRLIDIVSPKPCTAILRHGPGHQSRTTCEVLGPHEIHEALYYPDGGYGTTARWKGEEAYSGHFDEPTDVED